MYYCAEEFKLIDGLINSMKRAEDIQWIDGLMNSKWMNTWMYA